MADSDFTWSGLEVVPNQEACRGDFAASRELGEGQALDQIQRNFNYTAPITVRFTKN
jgi:hypothetical protein